MIVECLQSHNSEEAYFIAYPNSSIVVDNVYNWIDLISRLVIFGIN